MTGRLVERDERCLSDEKGVRRVFEREVNLIHYLPSAAFSRPFYSEAFTDFGAHLNIPTFTQILRHRLLQIDHRFWSIPSAFREASRV